MASNRSNDMDTGDVWRALREDRRAHLAAVMPAREAAIAALADSGFTVKRMQDGYRINGRLDLYPTRQRYHHLPTGRRGGYTDPLQCARRWLKGQL